MTDHETTARRRALGLRLRLLRTRAGLSQTDLASRLGWSKGSIVNYESGRRSPDSIEIPRLADALGADALVLLGERVLDVTVQELGRSGLDASGRELDEAGVTVDGAAPGKRGRRGGCEFAERKRRGVR